jgi:hypothetical protein
MDGWVWIVIIAVVVIAIIAYVVSQRSSAASAERSRGAGGRDRGSRPDTPGGTRRGSSSSGRAASAGPAGTSRGTGANRGDDDIDVERSRGERNRGDRADDELRRHDDDTPPRR